MIPTEHWTAIEARKKRDMIIRNAVLDELVKKSHITTNSDYFEGKEVVLVSDIRELRRKAGE